MHLPAQMATYLRLIIDSHIIPFSAKVKRRRDGFRVLITINNQRKTGREP
jgi:Predicted nucleotidyltransferase